MKVMILDDDTFKSDLMVDYLDGLVPKNNIVVCTTRNEGLREITNNQDYDLLILDMQFPIMRGMGIDRDCGIGVLKELTRRKINIPIVFFSSCLRDVKQYDDNGLVLGYIVTDSGNIREVMEHYISMLNE